MSRDSSGREISPPGRRFVCWFCFLGALSGFAMPIGQAIAGAPGSALRPAPRPRFDSESEATLMLNLESHDPQLLGYLIPSSGLRGAKPTPAKFAIKLVAGEHSVRASLRFERGDAVLAGKFIPSMQLETRGAQRLLGMRRFALLDLKVPGTREKLRTYSQLRREGVLAPRTRIVRARVNGQDLGAMVIEEQFSKELLESQHRRDGVLFRLRKDDLPVATVDAFGNKKFKKSKLLSAQRSVAAGLLQAYLQSSLSADQVFDIRQWARFLAVLELRGATSLLHPEQLRFYLNPVTLRLEPVGHADCPCIGGSSVQAGVMNHGWARQLLADSKIRKAALAALLELAGQPDGSDRQTRISPREIGLSTVAWQARNHSFLVKSQARLAARADRILSLGSNLWSSSGRAAASESDGRLEPGPNRVALARSPVPRASVKQALALHPFLEWDASANSFRVGPGVYQVKQPLVLAEGTALDVSPGTTLRFAKSSYLVASGPLRLRGTSAKPIVFEGIEGQSWPGIVSLSAAGPHIWQFATIRETHGVSLGPWQLTGGVTLRNSDCRFDHLTIAGTSAEDGLNLIRSHVSSVELRISDTSSDAFDCDFCSGELRGGSFHGIGGDAIDVSGSQLRIQGVLLQEIRDKAISAGEVSDLEVRGVRIERAGTALASKDGSRVTIEDSRFSAIRHAAIMAYMKKSEYGPGQVIARNIQMTDVGRPAVVQAGSKIEIDGVALTPEDVDVEDLYRHGYMKK